MLFCKAMPEQAENITEILDTFCYYSGQKVNRNKSQIFFSPNVLNGTVADIYRKVGFVWVEDLRIYIGMSLIHKRVGVSTFDFVVNIVCNRLNG